MQTSTRPHNAALMAEALAELLVTKLNLNGHHSDAWSRLRKDHSITAVNPTENTMSCRSRLEVMSL